MVQKKDLLGGWLGIQCGLFIQSTALGVREESRQHIEQSTMKALSEMVCPNILLSKRWTELLLITSGCLLWFRSPWWRWVRGDRLASQSDSWQILKLMH